MSATGTAELVCDNCSESITVDLIGPDVRGAGPTTIEDAVEQESWSWHGTLLDRLLCEQCAEDEDEDE